MSRGEILGPVIGFTGLAGFAAAVVAVRVGALDELLAAAAPVAGMVLLVVAAVAVVGRGGGGTPRPALHSHSNRSRRSVVRHERAHRRTLRRVGGGGSSLRVWRNEHGTWSGRVTPHSTSRWYRLPVERRIAVYRAGSRAAPGTNCDWDKAQEAALLASVPQRNRDRVSRDADRWTR